MEEKKQKGKMEVVNSNNQKLSYEELNNACINISQQNQQLIQQNRALVNQINQLGSAYRRLDYLFAVLQHEKVIKDSGFVNKCIDEIKELMTLPSSQEDQEATSGSTSK